MYLLVLYFPLISSICCGFFGHYLGKNGAVNIALYCMFISVIISFFIFKDIVLGEKIVVIPLFNYIDVYGLTIHCELIFDVLASIMIVIVLNISFLVHVYSVEYMYGDPHLIRFLAFLSLFTFFMLVLVTGANCIIFFLG